MTKRLLAVFVLLFSILPGFASAAVIGTLYEAAVPVADQSVTARERGMREALGIVLVRVTGTRAAPQQARMAELLARAPTLVQQFRFEQHPTIDVETGEPVPVLHLWVRFDEAAVQRALIDRDVPVWGRERPSTLVWIAYDDGTQRALLDDAAPPMFKALVEEVAGLRGLPVVWPLMDLQDRAALPFTEVWGGFEDRIIEASVRYQPNAILVGRLFRVDAVRWGARWSVIEGSDFRRVEPLPGVLPVVLGEGVHWIADAFAERAALVPQGISDGRTRLVISGILKLTDYAEALRYLEGLSQVAGVVLERVEEDRIVVAVDLRGSESQLRQAIMLGSRLRADDAGGPQHYRYRQ